MNLSFRNVLNFVTPSQEDQPIWKWFGVAIALLLIIAGVVGDEANVQTLSNYLLIAAVIVGTLVQWLWKPVVLVGCWMALFWAIKHMIREGVSEALEEHRHWLEKR